MFVRDAPDDDGDRSLAQRVELRLRLGTGRRQDVEADHSRVGRAPNPGQSALDLDDAAGSRRQLNPDARGQGSLQSLVSRRLRRRRH